MPLPKLKPHSSQDTLLQWAGLLVRQLDRRQQVVASGEITPAFDSTLLQVVDQAVELGAEVFLQAKNAEAAALTGVFVRDVVDGSFIVEYSTAVGTEVFAYGVIGPGGAGDDQ